MAVFPAYAGVILNPGKMDKWLTGFPRIRGGDPWRLAVRRAAEMLSPHPRGCSELKIILSGYDELANATETLIHWNYNKILQMR